MKNDIFKNDIFKNYIFKNYVFKNYIFKNYIFKNYIFKNYIFKNYIFNNVLMNNKYIYMNNFTIDIISYCSSLSAVISMAQAVSNLCVSRKVFLKHQVNCNTVCGAMQDLPWGNIWLADNPVEVLNEHLSLLVIRYVPTKVISVRNKDKH